MSRGASLGGEGQSSYFNSVTGTNDYERQSWRDSYNGGRAAGDLTGNTNARLDAERDAFQGTTWSGSSTQPSALEFAQSLGGVGYPAVSNGPQSSVSGGPGNAVVVSAPRKASGGSLTLAGPLKATQKDEATQIMMGGNWFLPNLHWNDAAEWEERYAEPGEWLGGLALMGADGVYNAGRLADWYLGTNIVSGQKRETVKLDTQLESGGAWGAIADSFGRQFSTWDRQLHEVVGAGRPYVGGGF